MAKDLLTSSQVRDPSHERFIRLFLQSERELLRYVLAIVPNVEDARDIVQESAVSLWEKFGDYDPAQPFTPWACRFALNKAKAFIRSQARRQRFLAEDVVDLLEQRRKETGDHLDEREAHLKRCLEKLPAVKAEILRAHYFDGLSIAQLTGKFNRGQEAIYKMLQRIRLQLHQCIHKKMQMEGRS